ncbi:MAG: preprotein translocase subunit YajC [Oscillospiraceae bacterium]|nr:preprotein translocase subunit YajC [Oscillospiraceae bacterium]
MMDTTMYYVIVIAMFVALSYFMIIRPQRKKDRKMREMMGGLQVGSRVVTIGGVVGKVMSMDDDEIVLETSIEKTLINFKKTAVKDIENSLEV